MDKEIAFEAGVFGVNGSQHSLVTRDLKEAADFIKAHDHEGAVISIAIRADNEECYKLLNKLQS